MSSSICPASSGRSAPIASIAVFASARSPARACRRRPRRASRRSRASSCADLGLAQRLEHALDRDVRLRRARERRRVGRGRLPGVATRAHVACRGVGSRGARRGLLEVRSGRRDRLGLSQCARPSVPARRRSPRAWRPPASGRAGARRRSPRERRGTAPRRSPRRPGATHSISCSSRARAGIGSPRSKSISSPESP